MTFSQKMRILGILILGLVHINSHEAHAALTNNQIAEFREAFTLFDSSGTGIPITDLPIAMNSLGQYPTEAELQHLIKEVGTNGNNTINFLEFQTIMARSMQNNK